ncbi:hypothetical protein COHA_009629 [Chlorella ohadii]|uniref:Uncharacterized protein n=1 Tax=Chlorella ohadii TaxID=2649997 RepID=A0AAD5DHW2_9CHLO|nr:hypothetical protein COHA_009629 [Chlorella ohadii]
MRLCLWPIRLSPFALPLHTATPLVTRMELPPSPTACTCAALWVATNVSEVRYDAAVKQAVPLLWDYFFSCNNESLRLRETVPLTVHYRTALHPHTGERRNYTVAMYLPYLFQHRPREARILEEAQALAEALEHAGHSDYEPGELLVASYDHPTKHFPRRHSEVWIRGTGSNRSAGATMAAQH